MFFRLLKVTGRKRCGKSRFVLAGALVCAGMFGMIWLLLSNDPQLTVFIEEASLINHENGSGQTGFSVTFHVGNSGSSSIWLARQGSSPVHVLEVFVNNIWQRHSTGVVPSHSARHLSYIEVKPNDIRMFQAGPIPVHASKLKVGVMIGVNRRLELPFLNANFSLPGSPSNLFPVTTSWVYSTTMQLTQRGEYIFPKAISNKSQD